MFTYPVLSENEIQERRSGFKDGEIYRLKVVSAESYTHKDSGNSVLKLKFQSDNKAMVTGYLVGSENMVHQIKHFWKSAGEPESYQGQHADSEFLDKVVWAKIKLEKERNGERMFPRIVDYVVKNESDHADIIEDEFPDMPY